MTKLRILPLACIAMITVIAVTSCRHGQGGLTAGSDADSINWED